MDRDRGSSYNKTMTTQEMLQALQNIIAVHGPDAFIRLADPNTDDAYRFTIYTQSSSAGTDIFLIPEPSDI